MTTTTIARTRSRALPSARPGWAQLPEGWQPYAVFTLLPVWWLLGLSFFMWPLIALPSSCSCETSQTCCRNGSRIASCSGQGLKSNPRCGR